CAEDRNDIARRWRFAGEQLNSHFTTPSDLSGNLQRFRALAAMIGGSSILSRDPGTGQSVRHFNYLGNGGVRLAATCREANDEPAAVVAFAHGFTAYMGAYINVLRTLTAAGFVTYAVDHRGHGYSEG